MPPDRENAPYAGETLIYAVDGPFEQTPTLREQYEFAYLMEHNGAQLRLFVPEEVWRSPHCLSSGAGRIAAGRFEFCA
jgi:hypothetical protein